MKLILRIINRYFPLMTIVERLSDLISASKLSVRAFAAKCGIKQQTISNQLNGVRELSLSTVISVLTSNEDISAEWLLRGEGDMRKGKNKDDAKTLERLNKLVDTIGTLQDTINAKNDQITSLTERISQLEKQTSSK